jgi:hypothetical protein
MASAARFVAARLRAALVLALLSGAAGAVLACPDDGGPTCGGGSAPALGADTTSLFK